MPDRVSSLCRARPERTTRRNRQIHNNRGSLPQTSRKLIEEYSKHIDFKGVIDNLDPMEMHRTALNIFRLRIAIYRN